MHTARLAAAFAGCAVTAAAGGLALMTGHPGGLIHGTPHPVLAALGWATMCAVPLLGVGSLVAVLMLDARRIGWALHHDMTGLPAGRRHARTLAAATGGVWLSGLAGFTVLGLDPAGWITGGLAAAAVPTLWAGLRARVVWRDQHSTHLITATRRPASRRRPTRKATSA